MTRELVRFGIVMLIILLGFAMSLHALFWGSSEDYTYRDAFLDLFRAMLGDLQLLETISENNNGQEDVATTLVVVYLVIMTIIMLNLLIAVLSTAHAKVHGNIDMEYRVSSARLMGHYVWAAKQHILPAPFNLVIGAVWCVSYCLRQLCGWDTYDEVCNFTTKLINLVFFCPVVFAVGSLAWLVLLPRHLWDKCTSSCGDRGCKARVRKIMLHFTRDGPLFLGYLWVTRVIELLCPIRYATYVKTKAGCLQSTKNSTNTRENGDQGAEGANRATDKNQETVITLAEMLGDSCDGVGIENIQDYVENPFKDLKVQRGDSKGEATVEHMKRLGSYLESKMNARAGDLNSKMDAMASEIQQLKGIVQQLSGVRNNIQPRAFELENNGMEASRGQRVLSW